MIVVLALVLVVGTFGTAGAQVLFGVPPYDQVRIDGTRTGSGLLVLAPPADEEGFRFGDSGVPHRAITAAEPTSMLVVGIAMLALARLRSRRR